MSPEQVQQNMLGLSDAEDAVQFELQLAAQPDLVQEATSVKPDPFVIKLKHYFQDAIQSRTHRNRMGTNMSQEDYPPATQLETDEVLEQIRAKLKQNKAPVKSDRNGNTSSKEPNREKKEQKGQQEQPFRPTVRPPAATLIMCDDGESTGEVFRLRGDRFIIGRTEGDLQLPDDEQISSRHVALTRQVVSGQTRWVVTDLQSRNGLFVRVSKAPMTHMSEVLIGGGRYRLEIMQHAGAQTAAFEDAPARAPTTLAFQNNDVLGSEMLTEILAGGSGTRIMLNRDQYWFGSDPECEICRRQDPFVSGKHASLVRSQRGTWMLQSNSTVNGIWLRMPQVVLEQGKKCEFQIGEQRFRLRYGVPL